MLQISTLSSNSRQGSSVSSEEGVAENNRAGSIESRLTLTQDYLVTKIFSPYIFYTTNKLNQKP